VSAETAPTEDRLVKGRLTLAARRLARNHVPKVPSKASRYRHALSSGGRLYLSIWLAGEDFFGDRSSPSLGVQGEALLTSASVSAKLVKGK
jgi:hypothetical protein